MDVISFLKMDCIDNDCETPQAQEGDWKRNGTMLQSQHLLYLCFHCAVERQRILAHCIDGHLIAVSHAEKVTATKPYAKK